MPLLSYRCPECDARFEELMIVAQKSVACPRCGGTAERLYQGKCSFGARKGDSDGASGTKSCSHRCAGCQGCAH